MSKLSLPHPPPKKIIFFVHYRYLERLLLVHGQWSYHRMTSCLRCFFYKNFAYTFSQFLFAFFCGFTAQVPVWYSIVYVCMYMIALSHSQFFILSLPFSVCNIEKLGVAWKRD